MYEFNAMKSKKYEINNKVKELKSRVIRQNNNIKNNNKYFQVFHIS